MSSSQCIWNRAEIEIWFWYLYRDLDRFYINGFWLSVDLAGRLYFGRISELILHPLPAEMKHHHIPIHLHGMVWVSNFNYYQLQLFQEINFIYGRPDQTGPHTNLSRMIVLRYLYNRSHLKSPCFTFGLEFEVPFPIC